MKLVWVGRCGGFRPAGFPRGSVNTWTVFVEGASDKSSNTSIGLVNVECVEHTLYVMCANVCGVTGYTCLCLEGG